MNPTNRPLFFLKLSLAAAFITLSLASSTKQVYSNTPNTYTLTAPNLSSVPANTVVLNVPFTLVQTSGTADSPQAKIRVTVTNQPEGSSVQFDQTTAPGTSPYNVLNDSYDSTGSFIIPTGTNRTDLFNIKFSMVGDYTIRYSLIDLNEANPDILDQTVAISVINSPNVPTENAPDANGQATANTTHPEVVVHSSIQPITITVNASTSNPTINFSSLINAGTGTLPKTTINTPDALIFIPSSVITGTSTWNGVLNAPTLTNVTLPQVDGETRTLVKTVDVGSTDTLLFDKGVRILLFGQAGKRTGVVKNGVFTETTLACTGDDQASADALPNGGDCKMDAGTDLVIWTKHFTTFVIFSSVATPPPSSGHSGSVATTTASTTISTTISTTTTILTTPTSTATTTTSTTTSSNTTPGSSNDTGSTTIAMSNNSVAPTISPSSPNQTSASSTASAFASQPSLTILGSIAGFLLLGGAFFLLFKRS